MVSEAIVQVGFLHSRTAFLPGAVDAWIDLIIGCIEDPPPSKLEPQRLFFFKYHPLMAESPSIWDYQHEDSKLDNYFGWDEVAINNMWE
ncbi:hypothetical protein PQX77_019369 [Marasmius sp. AFHP31]|nr:hypothetical protein PQX77_019369 [Marasmius sp. AFHP31]